MKKVNVSILNSYKNFKYGKKSKISKIFNLVFKNSEILDKLDTLFIKTKKYSFDVVFMSDNEIKTINRDYRGIDKPTDVITFSLFADDKNSCPINDEINLGEIIVSVDTANKQAKKGLDYEIDLLILHGVLHLLGFDHQTNEDYNFIVRIQNKIMKELYCA